MFNDLKKELSTLRYTSMLLLAGACGCAGPGGAQMQTAWSRGYMLQPGDTLPTIAQQRYGHREYADLLARHNSVTPDSLTAGDRLELPDMDEMVLALPALREYEGTLTGLLRGRTLFCQLAPDLRRARDGASPGEDKAVPVELARSLIDAAEAFEKAGNDVGALRTSGESYPERVHAAIERAVEELRVHASGRYYGRRISVSQTEQAVARIFAELLTWQRVLAGDLPPAQLRYPRSTCGGG